MVVMPLSTARAQTARPVAVCRTTCRTRQTRIVSSNGSGGSGKPVVRQVLRVNKHHSSRHRLATPTHARFGDNFNGRSTDDDGYTADTPDALAATCPLPMNIEIKGDVPYSEASRRYRRTVFTNADWLQHRSNTRLFGNLSGTFTSGVVRSLVTEVTAVASLGLLCCVWNGLIGGFEDFHDVLHAPAFPNIHEVFLARLPALPFTLASPALGLLLVFRTNASYARWVEARVAWGRVVSHCRNVMRQSALWISINPDAKVRSAFPKSLRLFSNTCGTRLTLCFTYLRAASNSRARLKRVFPWIKPFQTTSTYTKYGAPRGVSRGVLRTEFRGLRTKWRYNGRYSRGWMHLPRTDYSGRRTARYRRSRIWAAP